MPLVTANQFDLAPNFSNLGQSIVQGAQLGSLYRNKKRQDEALAAEKAQQAQISQFSQAALSGDKAALGNLAGVDPQRANQLQTFLASMDENERNEMLRENENMTRGALNILKISGNDPAKARVALQNQVKEWKAQGLDTTRSEGALALDDGAMMQALQEQGSKGLEIDQFAKNILTPEGRKETVGTASQRDFQTYLDLQKTDPEKAEIFGRQAGFIRPTEQEKADIVVDKETRKEAAKANVARKQGFIDSGIDAADSVSNITRSIELLNTVETGGFDNLALSAKRLFGVEGADEGELSANLGKAMLAQLKPLFGAAFTVNEVEKLERIESNFGKSTEVNKRLLNNTLNIAQKAAKRGLAAAEDQGDKFTANEIRALLANIETAKAEEKEQEPNIDDLVNKYGN